jgi:Flp pilus assembly pilin Flp
MLQHLNQKRGQSTLEYAVLVVVIIGALLAMQTYIKKGVQGRLKGAADDIGDQFSPGNTNELRHTNRFSNTYETFNAGNSTSNLITESTNSTTNSAIVNVDQEYWGSNATST